MPISRDSIVEYINQFLLIDQYNDASKNGLQVEGSNEVKKIITGVSVCLELFEKAVEVKADMIIVHHGLLWNDVNPITGVLKERIKILLDNNISLLAYHLPLDANPILGNNVLIANQLGLKNQESFLEYNGNNIGIKGEIESVDFVEFKNNVDKKIGPINQTIQGRTKVQRVGVCSGGASREVESISNDNLDTYITGEIGESTKAYCEEARLNFISLGHYNSEVWGVRALGKKVSEEFDISVDFIRLDNPN